MKQVTFISEIITVVAEILAMGLATTRFTTDVTIIMTTIVRLLIAAMSIIDRIIEMQLVVATIGMKTILAGTIKREAITTRRSNQSSNSHNSRRNMDEPIDIGCAVFSCGKPKYLPYIIIDNPMKTLRFIIDTGAEFSITNENLCNPKWNMPH